MKQEEFIIISKDAIFIISSHYIIFSTSDNTFII